MEQLFPFGKPVKGTELIDRQNEIDSMVKDLSGSQSIILASPRRLGKSSVIMEALRRLKKAGFLTAYIDLFEAASIREFAEKIIEGTLANETSRIRAVLRSLKENLSGFLRQAQFKYLWQGHEFILSFGDPKADTQKLLEEALDFPEKYAKKRKKKIVVAIDEFGELVNWNGNLLKKLRAKFQRHDRTAYVFSGSQESLIRRLFGDKAQAFYGFGKLIGIGPLPEKELVDYLLANFRKAGIKVKREILVSLAGRMGCHPHYTKIYAQSVYDSVSGRKKEIDMQDLEEGYEKAFFYIKGELEKEWAELSKAPLQKRVLKLLATGGKTPYSKNSLPDTEKSSIYLALREIEEKGIIKKVERGRFMFINPFFSEYLKRLDEGTL